jgi:hypothetical protein
MKKILFKPEMVRAILAGVKTQTRRIHANMENPRYNVGETVYVGETYSTTAAELWPSEGKIYYFADGIMLKTSPMACWKSGMFMPKKYARIFLKITEAKKQKLGDITQSDAAREGFAAQQYGRPLHTFKKYFRSINPSATEDTKVWAYTFEVAKR